jgi:serine/threonine protein kinase
MSVVDDVDGALEALLGGDPEGDRPEPSTPPRASSTIGLRPRIHRDGATPYRRGTIVGGRYVIQEPLARGPRSIVYRAVQLPVGREVALKVFAEDAIDLDAIGEAVLARLGRAAAVVHPQLASVLDFGRVDGTIFVATELWPGDTLARVLGRSGALAPARALAVTLQLARVVRAAHARGVVHGDLRPGHVWLVDADEPELQDAIQVLGLGHPTPVTDARTASGLERLRFAAPETLADGVEDVTTDVYGVGAALWAMLAGTAPFRAGDRGEALRVRVDVPRIVDVDPRARVPAELELIARRCLDPEPTRRHASAEQLLVELRAAVALVPDAASAPRLTDTTGDVRPRVSAPSARRSEGAGEARVTPSAVAPARPSESVIRRELDRLADSVGAPRADLDARAKTPSSAVRAAPVTLRGAPRAAPTGRPSARPAPRRAEHGPSLGAWLALALALVLVFVGLWLQRG